MIAAVAATLRQFEYVREWDDEFLKLFPHRFDYIYALHPEPGTKPDWKTQSNHPLSDRLIRQGAYLYGVRFGAQTNYLMLDIDSSSIYHPRRDEFAIHRIQAALEPLGLVCNVACTSSYSGGIHVYFPFTEPQSSWEIALVATTLLENAGFKIAPGLLEIFPNPKGYVAEGNKSLYAAHRLPLQAGSYILNQDWAQTISHQSTFVTNWKFAQARNDINSLQLTQILKQARRKQYRISGNAQKFLNDLNAEIELGWTEPGQTNHLLGRIAMREYIFRHVIDGGKPLAGQTLAAAISQVARSLPGFDQWCNHRNELEQKAAYWVRSVEASPYYHYGHGKKLEIAQLEEPAEPKINWNQQQTDNARQRITAAISDLLNKNALPVQAKARCIALSAYSISATTLYKHKNLWHPDFLLNSTNSPSESPESLPYGELHPLPPNSANVESPESLPYGELHPVLPNKLVGLDGEGAAPQPPSLSPANEVGGCGGFSTGREPDSAAPNTKSEPQLEKVNAALRDGTLRDVYWSSTHDCRCVVFHNGIIMPVEQWVNQQPQLDAPLEPASEGIELVRRVIEQIKAKEAARKAEKLAEQIRSFDIFP